MILRMRSDLAIVAERAAETVGVRIKRRRKELGKTQKELAAEAGINQGYLSLIERDKAAPRRPTFDALAVALDWPQGVLIGGSQAHDSPQPYETRELPLPRVDPGRPTIGLAGAARDVPRPAAPAVAGLLLPSALV